MWVFPTQHTPRLVSDQRVNKTQLPLNELAFQDHQFHYNKIQQSEIKKSTLVGDQTAAKTISLLHLFFYLYL